MKKFLLIVLTLLGGTLCLQAEDWSAMKTALDTMVNAKIVKWSKSVPKDSLAKQFYSVANSYGNSLKPSYATTGGTGSGSGGIGSGSGSTGSGSGGSGTGSSSSSAISSVIPGLGAESSNDTLIVNRIDDKEEQCTAEDTVYFMGPIDETRQIFKDSIFVHRLSHYLAHVGGDAMKISVEDAGTLKIYAIPFFYASSEKINLKKADGTELYSSSLKTTTSEATVNWNNFGASVCNYNLTHPQEALDIASIIGSTGTTDSGSSTSGSSTIPATAEPKDTTLNCYEIHYINVVKGEYTLSFSGDVMIYGIELVRSGTKQSMINFPEDGTDNLDLGEVEIDMETLEGTNRKPYTVLLFEKSDANDTYIELLSTENGFRKGDEVVIAGAYRSSDEKVGKFELTTDVDKKSAVLFTTSQLVNGRTDDNAPKEESYKLMLDADRLFVKTSDDTNTTLFITKLKLIRAGDADKSYRQGPKLISKIVRWKEDVSAGSLADSYTSQDNSYAAPKISSSSVGKNKDQSVPDGAPSDSLKLFRTDVDKVQSLISDTVYFRSSVDPCSNHYKDSIYVTRFTNPLRTAAASGEKNVLKLELLTEGTLKIYARPTDGNAADRTILVTQGDREVINVALPVDGDKAVEKSVNTSAFSSTHNYNLANPPKSSGRGKGSSTPTNLDVYPVLYSRVDAGELTLEYPVGAVDIYGVELVMIDQSGLKALIDYPDDSKDGIERNGSKFEMVKLQNGKQKTCYKFDKNRTDSYIELQVEGGFKSGDIVKIAGLINEDDNLKVGKLVLFTKDEAGNSVIATTDELINTKTAKGEPFVESFTLGGDYSELYIGRSDDCEVTCYLSCVKVLGDRSNEETAQIRAFHRQNKSIYDSNDDATGIKSVKTVQTDAPLYNLSGQRVGSNYKGVVIQNGRKLIKK